MSNDAPETRLGGVAATLFGVIFLLIAWDLFEDFRRGTGGLHVGIEFAVLLAGNPLEDISALRRPVAVFKGDRWYDPARLYEAVGIRPFTR